MATPGRPQAEAPRFSFTVFAGPGPAEVVRRYSRYAGRQPVPRPWFFGPWVQFSGPVARAVPRRATCPRRWPRPTRTTSPAAPTAARAREREQAPPAPPRAGLQDHHLLQPARLHRPTSRCTTTAARQGLFVKNPPGRAVRADQPVHAPTRSSRRSTSPTPAAATLFGRLLDDAIDDGYDGWMEDFGEYTPTDSRLRATASGGLEMHNRYPVIYHGASTAHTAGAAATSRCSCAPGYHGVQPHARMVWGGDPTEDWSCADGLCAALHQAVNTGLLGRRLPGLGHRRLPRDRRTPRTDDELNVALAAARARSAASCARRPTATASATTEPTARRSGAPPCSGIWRRYAKLRTQLYPYIAAASRAYQRTGMPIVRHLALAYPGDPAGGRAAQTRVHVRPRPAGRAGDRAAARAPARCTCRAGAGSTCGARLAYDARARRACGSAARRRWPAGATVTRARAARRAAAAGARRAMLALLPPGHGHPRRRGPARGLVHLRERRYRLNVLAFPRGSSRADLGTGVRALSVERRGRWSLRLRAAAQRRHVVPPPGLDGHPARARSGRAACRRRAGG